MDPIQEILSLLGQSEIDDEQKTRLAELYASLTDEQLAEVESTLSDEFDRVRSGDITADSVAYLTNIADAVDAVRAIAQSHIEEANARADVVAQLESRMQAVSEPQAEEPEPELEPEIEIEEVPVLVDAGIVETAPQAEAPVVEAAPVETVTAATATKGEIMSRTPKQFTAQEAPRNRVTIKAAGGGLFDNTHQIEESLIDRYRDLAGTGRHGVGRFRVATIEGNAPDSRRLADNRVTDVNDMVTEVRQAITTPGGAESLIAAGGICAPVDVYYGLDSISQAGRPLREALAQFTSRRGGISFSTPLGLDDILFSTTPTVGNAIGVVTEAQDAAGDVTKSIQCIECGDQVEVRVDAVYLNLCFGNFMSRTFPERDSQFTDLSLAQFARVSEQRLLAAMAANSTPVNAPQNLGASRDLITALNSAAINYRARHRMPVGGTVDVVLPAWVGLGLLPDDQTNALQSFGEQFTYTSAWVEARLAERNIRVINWFQDDFTTAVTAGGPLNAYPSTFFALMFHPGAHVFVDSGTLDIGVYRDSTMIAENKFGTFTEEFWTTAMWGLESLKINFSLCASGASAGSVAPTCGS